MEKKYCQCKYMACCFYYITVTKSNDVIVKIFVNIIVKSNASMWQILLLWQISFTSQNHLWMIWHEDAIEDQHFKTITGKKRTKHTASFSQLRAIITQVWGSLHNAGWGQQSKTWCKCTCGSVKLNISSMCLDSNQFGYLLSKILASNNAWTFIWLGAYSAWFTKSV